MIDVLTKISNNPWTQSLIITLLKGQATALPFKMHTAVGSASDLKAGGPTFETRSGHIISFLHRPLIHEGQLSDNGGRMST